MTPQSVTYSASGSCATFGFDFPVPEANDLEVLLNGAVQTSGFTLLGTGSTEGGAIRFDTAPSAGTAVTIRRAGQVQVSGSDAPGFLETKIVAGSHITVTKTTDAAGEHLTIATDIDPAQFQPRDPELDWLAANLSGAGKALAGATDAAAQRSALGLAAVASSGSYNDLIDKPVLGSAASHDAADFAAASDVAADETLMLELALFTWNNAGFSAQPLTGGLVDAFNADTIGANSSGQGYDASVKAYANNATQVFSYTGADQSFTVPAGVTSIDVKLWGAGGRGMTSPGGAGGYTGGRLAVTPGEVLTFKVGERGHDAAAWVTIGSYSNWGYGGGAATGSDHTLSGGGLTDIWRGSTPLAIAGGGGGGCGSDAGIGGVGGGPSGQSGTGTWPGLAGTQSAAGAQGGGTPSPAVGGFGYGGGGSGHGYAFGGGGGGGYYGGGGGGGSYDGSWHGGGGGGGSGYTGGLSNAVTTAGTGVTPPNTSDADYVAGIGIGGAAGQPGGNGLVVLSYISNMTLVSNALSPAPASAPTKVRMLVLWKDLSGSAVLNTDFTAEATRDGSTWNAGTLSDTGLTISGFKVLSANIDVAAQPAGTAVKYRLRTLNSKAQQVKGVAYLTK